jgi:hypothetical protein
MGSRPLELFDGLPAMLSHYCRIACRTTLKARILHHLRAGSGSRRPLAVARCAFNHGFCCVRVSIIGLWKVGMVRVFRQDVKLENAIGSHACSLEASSHVTNSIPFGCPLTSYRYHRALRPNTEGQVNQINGRTPRPCAGVPTHRTCVGLG